MSQDIDILLLQAGHATLMRELEQSFRVHELWLAEDREALLAQVGPVIRGLVVIGGESGPVDEALIEKLPKLELIANYGVGYDDIDAAAAVRRGIVVTNTPDVLNDEVADFCLGLLLATIRELPQADRHVRSGMWRSGEFHITTSLRGRTVGIYGLGRIGKRIARRLEGFDVETRYCGRSKQPDVPYEYEPDLVALARRVDTLICAVPGGASTRHTVNAQVLKALGARGILINIGRGSTVDEDALIEALENKVIHAAGLDVFEHEPNVPDGLLAMDNVVLLPHVGSGSDVTREAMARLVLDNVADWFAGRGARTPVPETILVL